MWLLAYWVDAKTTSTPALYRDLPENTYLNMITVRLALSFWLFFGNSHDILKDKYFFGSKLALTDEVKFPRWTAIHQGSPYKLINAKKGPLARNLAVFLRPVRVIVIGTFGIFNHNQGRPALSVEDIFRLAEVA